MAGMYLWDGDSPSVRLYLVASVWCKMMMMIIIIIIVVVVVVVVVASVSQTFSP
jgi:hypothetical protein